MPIVEIVGSFLSVHTHGLRIYPKKTRGAYVCGANHALGTHCHVVANGHWEASDVPLATWAEKGAACPTIFWHID